jgi:outer membrane protein assembly factor BamB
VFGPEGVPVIGAPGVGADGGTPIYSPSAGSVYAFNDATGATEPVGASGQLASVPISPDITSVLGGHPVDAAEGLSRLAA